jgi:hypothetical protein
MVAKIFVPLLLVSIAASFSVVYSVKYECSYLHPSPSAPMGCLIRCTECVKSCRSRGSEKYNYTCVYDESGDETCKCEDSAKSQLVQILTKVAPAGERIIDCNLEPNTGTKCDQACDTCRKMCAIQGRFNWRGICTLKQDSTGSSTNISCTCLP